MEALLLLARIILAAVFLIAGMAKLVDRRGSIQAMRDFGLPERLAGPAGIALPLVEIAVALALIPTGSARWGALGALALLLAFVGGIAINMARGKAPDCHCFGQLHSEPAGRSTLIRNGVLSAVATFVLVAGWTDPGASAVAWIGDLSATEGVLLLISAIVVALLAVEGWALFHLLQQNGRLLLRLDALEAAVEQGTPMERPESAAQGTIVGLRVGTPAPEFSLRNLAGQATTLADLRVANTPTMLVFSDPGCGPCTALMPDIGRWQQEHAGTLTVAVVSRGAMEANRSKAGEHGVRNVVLQQDREVAEAFQVRGTPSAVLIRPDGMIGSAVVSGADAIRGLVASATAAPRPQVPLHAANGNTHGAAKPDLIGTSVPDATLSTLAGEEIALSVAIGNEPTTLLFWNPGCGFCTRMLDDLKALEADPPKGAPKMVVVSGGDSERNRAQRIASTVLLDQGFGLGRQLGATGTPSAVLIDADGKVASPVAVGAQAVLGLAKGERNATGAERAQGH